MVVVTKKIRVPRATLVFRCTLCGEEVVHEGALDSDRGPKGWALLLILGDRTSEVGRFAAPSTPELICNDCVPKKKAARRS